MNSWSGLMHEEFIDYYQILEINIFSSKESLKAAYKRLSIKHHPDNGGDEAYFSKIAEAYHVLEKDVSRKEYLSEWKQHKFLHNEFCKYPMGRSYDDIAFQPIRETVHEYMFYIMNKEYEKAYDMLCEESNKSIYKKDFIKWQELVGEVHEILAYESAFETITYDDKYGVIVVFQVKVREHNMLLNRQEEDYFRRMLLYEDHHWKIKLHHRNMQQIIKKYKQIISINKKNATKKWRKQGYKYHTRFLDKDSWMQNVEYEFLRFKRYERVFAIVILKFKNLTFREQKKIIKTFELSIRITDSFSLFGNDTVVVLLPETNEEGKNIFQNKIENELLTDGFHIIEQKSVFSKPLYSSSKEMLNEIIYTE